MSLVGRCKKNWLSHCTVVANVLVANELKPTNSVWPMNEVFDGRPALVDILYILVCPTDETERQMFCCPADWRHFHFIGDYLRVVQTLFVILSFFKLSSVRGTGLLCLPTNQLPTKEQRCILLPRLIYKS